MRVWDSVARMVDAASLPARRGLAPAQTQSNARRLARWSSFTPLLEATRLSKTVPSLPLQPLRGRGRNQTEPPRLTWPIAAPMRLSGMPCGQEKLSSKASTPTSSHRPTISSHAPRLYSSWDFARRPTPPPSYSARAEVVHPATESRARFFCYERPWKCVSTRVARPP